MNVRISKMVLAAGLFLAVTGCSVAVTQFTKTWKEPEYTGPKFSKTAVVVVADKAVNRILFENEIVRLLHEKGVSAVASVDLMPPDEAVTKETVETALTGHAVDSVLALRLLRVDEERQYVPPNVRITPGGYHGHFSAAGAMTFDPGYFEYSIAVKVESKLYETAGATLVWSAESETVNPDSAKEMMKSFCGPLVEQVVTTGLF